MPFGGWLCLCIHLNSATLHPSMWRFLPPRRFFVVTLSLSFTLFVISLSLWRVNLATVGRENHETSVSFSASERLTQLFSPPILPDHPLYIFGMIADRVDLLFSPPEKHFGLQLQYANARLLTAQVLIARGQLNLALSTITKSEKYLIAAAGDIPPLPPQKTTAARENALETI